MKKKLTSLALLLIAMILCAASCADKPNNTPTDNDRAVISQEASGIVSDGLISESNLPQNPEILDWYEESKARELLPYALLYSKDASDGKWHCWLYVGTWQEGNKLTLGRLDTDGFCLTMDYTTAAEISEVGASGAFHFSFAYDGEPSFEFLINGDTDGLIVTISDVSVAP